LQMDSFTRARAVTTGDREMKVAVVLPGAGYTADHPLLFWAAEILAEHGWHVEAVRWEVDEAAWQDSSAGRAASKISSTIISFIYSQPAKT